MLMNEHDKKMLGAVRAFNHYDLYSKSDDVPNVEKLKMRFYQNTLFFGSHMIIRFRPYYLELIDEYFPTKVVRW
jgi:inositol oxygenase